MVPNIRELKNGTIVLITSESLLDQVQNKLLVTKNISAEKMYRENTVWANVTLLSLKYSGDLILENMMLG